MLLPTHVFKSVFTEGLQSAGIMPARGHYDPGLMSHHLVEKTSFQNNLMSRCKCPSVTSTTKERYTAICDMATSNEEKAQSEEPQVGEGLIR